MQTIRQIVGATPRASFARPYIREEEDGTATIKAGSPADAVRVIEALRAGGYAARLEGPREATRVRAAALACLL
jgi:hypothetical protein